MMDIKAESEVYRKRYRRFLLACSIGIVAGAGYGLLVLAEILRAYGDIDLLSVLDQLYHAEYRPELLAGSSMGIVFAFGFFTSFHCVGMCGGLMLSQISPQPSGETDLASGTFAWWGPSLAYNGGRMVTNVIIGGFAGGAGQFITLSTESRSIIPLVSGTVMLVMGLDLLVGIPVIKRAREAVYSSVPRVVLEKLFGRTAGGPFYMGVLTGLMPCAPLLAAQIFALGTGNAAQGAVAMFFFTLGTTPVLFGLGIFTTRLTRNHLAILKASGVLILLLGLLMIGQAVHGAMLGTTQAGCCP